MRRRYLLAGSGVALGMAVIVVGASSTPPPTQDARIAGAPLSQPPASEVAAFASLAVDTPIPAGVAERRPAPTPTAISGPAPTIDLGSITLEGDHYIARLTDGSRATLTLDPALQKLAEKLLAEARAPRGAIVAMAPDGRILALAGRRTQSPEGGIDGTLDASLATSPWAPAASVFKLVTASALLEAGVDPDDKICFHGGIRSVLESNLRDDRRDSRCETLGFGVAHSNNAILGKLAFQKLQPNKLAATAHKFGWTSALGELAGTVGAIEMPAARNLDFAKVAAGFTAPGGGGVKLSVMGGAMIAATFAGDGKQPTPTLIASIDGTPIPTPVGHRVISVTHAREVAKMMMQTCDEGSAAKSFGRGLKHKVAGKTGTLTKTEPFHMEHSWFVGFAPAEKPELVVSVLFGNPENWHLRGQEAARRLIDHATRREKDRKHVKPPS